MTPGMWCWTAAAGAYLLFRLWYDNWRGPLRPAEIDALMKKSALTAGTDHTSQAHLRAYLEADDGREFLMFNLVRLQPGPGLHPQTGKPASARQLLDDYVKGFVSVMVRYAGHPVIATRKVGGYIDAWGVEADPGWSVAAFMRYRSRRDMMRLALHPRFAQAHPLKLLAIAQTFSFPTQTAMSLALRPRASVALLLALAAALAHLALLAW